MVLAGQWRHQPLRRLLHAFLIPGPISRHIAQSSFPSVCVLVFAIFKGPDVHLVFSAASFLLRTDVRYVMLLRTRIRKSM